MLQRLLRGISGAQRGSVSERLEDRICLLMRSRLLSSELYCQREGNKQLNSGIESANIPNFHQSLDKLCLLSEVSSV